MTFNVSDASFNLLLPKYLKWILCPQQHYDPLRPISIISVLELCTASMCLKVPYLFSAFRSQIKLHLHWEAYFDGSTPFRSCLILNNLKILHIPYFLHSTYHNLKICMYTFISYYLFSPPSPILQISWWQKLCWFLSSLYFWYLIDIPAYHEESINI